MNDTFTLLNITESLSLTAGELASHIVITTLLAVGIISSNIIIITISLKKKMFQSEAARRLIRTLAAVDLIIGSVYTLVIPNIISQTWVYGDTFCTLSGVFANDVLALEVYTITLISIERYVAICKPLTHHRILTRRMWIMSGILGATLVTAYTSFPLAGGLAYIVMEGAYICEVDYTKEIAHIYQQVYLMLAVGVPLFIVLVLNIRIIHTIRKQRRSILRQNCQLSQPALVGKGSLISGLLMLILSATMIPLITANTYEYLTQQRNDRFWPLTIVISNSFWNMCVYTFWSKSFRQGLLELMCSKSGRVHAES